MAILLLSIGGVIAGLAWLALFPLRRYLDRRQAIDIPNERSSHTRPTIRGGGLVIVVLTLAGTLPIVLLRAFNSSGTGVVFVGGAALIAAVSWIDDLRSLSNRVRFAAHSLAAIVVIAGFGYWEIVQLPAIGAVHLGWFGAIVTFVWIVGLTNAYNFMDGIDGIAGSQAVVAGIGWSLLGMALDQPFTAILAVLLAASSVGFLGHNWPPAKVFMGDVGSAFLGYSFATAPLILGAYSAAQPGTARLAVAAVLIVWPFVFDTVLTFLRRWRNGENVFAAHRSHLYQRLVIAGWQHQTVTLLYAGLAMLGVVLAYLFVTTTGFVTWLIVLGLPLCAGGLYGLVVQQERRVLRMKVLGTYETAP